MTYKQYIRNQKTDRKHLIVLVHGLAAKDESLDAFEKDCLKEFSCNECKGCGEGAECEVTSDVEIFRPKLPYKNLFSKIRLTKIADELSDTIKELIDQNDFKKVTIIAHSLGCQLARELYMLAWEETPSSIDKTPEFSIRSGSEWIKKVDRLVYIAGFHRGWTAESFIQRRMKFLGKMGDVFLSRKSTLMESHLGSESLISLRLKAQKLNRFFEKNHQIKAPFTIQIVGTRDDLVSPDVHLPSSISKGNIFLQIYKSGHADIIRTESYYSDQDQKEIGANRSKYLSRAVFWSGKTLEEHYPIEFMLHANKQSVVDKPDETVTDLVFVVHGIRDRAYWTPKLAAMIKQVADDYTAKTKNDEEFKLVETVHPTYGYFPILDFTFKGLRKAKVAWLADQFVHHRAKYPIANFHYVGHSNGTQIFVEALQAYQDLNFENVVFAGSVVRKDFLWSKYLRKRVKKLRNYVASSDWVVAMLPNGLQWTGDVFNLGSAGHTGFIELPKQSSYSTHVSSGENIEYINGNHGAAIQDTMWVEIANFILHGQNHAPDASQKYSEPPDIYIKEQGKHIKFASLFSWLLIILIVLSLSAILLMLITWMVSSFAGISDFSAGPFSGKFWAVWTDGSWISAIKGFPIAPVISILLFLWFVYFMAKKF